MTGKQARSDRHGRARCSLGGVELSRRLRQPRLAAHHARTLGCEGNLEIGLARDRARMQPVTARLNGSVGLSLAVDFGLMLEDMVFGRRSVRAATSTQRHVH
jgi:hypothetical protein